MTYDAKCYALAVACMEDHQHLTNRYARIQQLAQEIQTLIDDVIDGAQAHQGGRMSAIADVIISLEPGGHEFPVPPMVAAYINKLQRDNAKLRKELNAVVARDIGESSK